MFIGITFTFLRHLAFFYWFWLMLSQFGWFLRFHCHSPNILEFTRGSTMWVITVWELEWNKSLWKSDQKQKNEKRSGTDLKMKIRLLLLGCSGRWSHNHLLNLQADFHVFFSLLAGYKSLRYCGPKEYVKCIIPSTSKLIFKKATMYI